MEQLYLNKNIPTKRESESLKKYLREISKVALLTDDEEVALALKIRTGDQDALEKFVKANLRFVVSVAKQYQGTELTLSDLINEGNLGLIKAAQRFDPSRGFKFISYAVWWIRQCIMQAIAEQTRNVRLPLNRVSGLNKMNRVISTFEQEHERIPSIDEVADIMNLKVYEVEEYYVLSQKAISLDAPLHQDSDDEDQLTLGSRMISDELPTDYRVTYRDSMHIDIQTALSELPERDQTIVMHYVGIGCSSPKNLDDIGNEVNLTRERVRQIKERGLRKLRRSKNSHLREYLNSPV